jgi:hypothetical protein
MKGFTGGSQLLKYSRFSRFQIATQAALCLSSNSSSLMMVGQKRFAATGMSKDNEGIFSTVWRTQVAQQEGAKILPWLNRLPCVLGLKATNLRRVHNRTVRLGDEGILDLWKTQTWFSFFGFVLVFDDWLVDPGVVVAL